MGGKPTKNTENEKIENPKETKEKKNQIQIYHQ